MASDSGNRERLFFSTGEVCRSLGIAPHTIRYWEKSTGLKFRRPGGGRRRQFRREDLVRLERVRALLAEGYSLKGIRRRLKGRESERETTATGSADRRRTLEAVNAELRRLRELLERAG